MPDKKLTLEQRVEKLERQLQGATIAYQSVEDEEETPGSWRILTICGKKDQLYFTYDEPGNGCWVYNKASACRLFTPDDIRDALDYAPFPLKGYSTLRIEEELPTKLNDAYLIVCYHSKKANELMYYSDNAKAKIKRTGDWTKSLGFARRLTAAEAITIINTYPKSPKGYGAPQVVIQGNEHKE